MKALSLLKNQVDFLKENASIEIKNVLSPKLISYFNSVIAEKPIQLNPLEFSVGCQIIILGCDIPLYACSLFLDQTINLINSRNHEKVHLHNIPCSDQ